MKAKFFLILLYIGVTCHAQVDDRISTIDFVQILNNNNEEALYYFENNWKALRDAAVQKGYIGSYQILETPSSEDVPFHLMLITTYSNRIQYNLRENNFSELIKAIGGPKLMNDKKPSEFRKTSFSRELVRHLD